MSVKNFKQLTEDAATNEELAKKLAEADKQARKTGDKTVYIKAAAELGYEVTEQDLPDDDLVKLNEKQLDDVAGGYLWFDEETEDEHEISCIHLWFKGVKSAKCPKSKSGKHLFEFKNKKLFEGGSYYKCKYCGTEAWT